MICIIGLTCSVIAFSYSLFTQLISFHNRRLKVLCKSFSFAIFLLHVKVQSTLVISKLKGPSETLRDIRSSTYQIFRIEENTNRTTKFHK